jgi:protein phosphatase
VSSAAVSSSPIFRRVQVGGATDRGRVREKNEDHFVVAEVTRALHVQASSLPQPEMLFGDARVRGNLFIVADGMGGHNAGEQASWLAVVTIEDMLINTLRWFFRLTGDAILTEFQSAVRAADERIFHEAARQPALRGMGTTLTMAYVVNRTLFSVHVGDSRLYVHRNTKMYQLTNDHTLVGELVRSNAIDAEAAARHPMRNVITNSVGGDKPGVNPEVHKVALEPYDTLLLCSDGLTEMVADAEIAELLAGDEEPQELCEKLIARANDKGGHDNITAVVARFLP